MTARQPTDLSDLADEPRSIDLRGFWSIVRRRAVLIVSLTVIGALAGAGYAVLSGHTYSAMAEVLTQANMSTEQAVTQSPPVVKGAARLLHMQPAALQAAAAKDLTVTVPATTLTVSTMLQISWKADSPAAAQAGANAFAKAYLSYRRALLTSEIQHLTTSLGQRLTVVQKEMTKLHTELGKTNTALPQHQSLALKLKQLESVQSSYNSKLASLSIYNASTGNLIAASRPVSPIGLSHKIIVALGVLLGLLLGLVLAFLRDAFDDRIADAAQFEQKLGAPALAVLPHEASLPEESWDARKASQRSQRSVIVTGASPDSQASESLRTLRAMLTALMVRRKMRTLLIVAADPSVSSGQIAAEVGVALAESGRRVLLIASNLRGSAMPQIFDLPNNAGLSDLLVGGGDPAVLLRKPRQAGGRVLPDRVTPLLSVLPRGPQLPYALEVLDSGAMQRLLHDLRESYDIVLLDSPPATDAADAYALAANVDGVIVAARQRHSEGRTVELLSRRLSQVGAELAGGIFLGDEQSGGRRKRRGTAERSQGPESIPSAPAIATEAQPVRRSAGTGQSVPPALSRRSPQRPDENWPSAAGGNAKRTNGR